MRREDVEGILGKYKEDLFLTFHKIASERTDGISYQICICFFRERCWPAFICLRTYTLIIEEE